MASEPDQYCQSCGGERGAAARFCLQCGEAFAAAGRPAGAGSGWRHLGWAGVAPAFLFFLPWITVSCQGMGFYQTLTGWTIANGFTVQGPFGQVQRIQGEADLFLVPIGAVLFGALFLGVVSKAGRGVAGLAACAAMVAGLGGAVTLFKYARWSEDVRRQAGGLLTLSAEAGWGLTLLCWLVGIAGAIVSLVEARRLAPLDAAPRPAESQPASVSRSPAEDWDRLGARQSLPFCTQCGGRVQPGADFCVECGAGLTARIQAPGLAGGV